jgi:DNA-binding NtrC family response regulator
MLTASRFLKVEVVPLSVVPMDSEDAFKPLSPPVVLIVDDEQLIADTLTAIFKKHGFETVTAYDGPSALKLGRLVKPNVLVTGILLPEMNEIELATSLVGYVPTCKVLLLSGHLAVADQELRTCLEDHGIEFLAKPVHPLVMMQRVSEMLGQGEFANR